MITPGEVEAVRELRRGVQARVCLASDATHGSAVVVFESESPAVQKALKALKDAIRAETLQSLGNILEGQRQWDAEREKVS